MKKPQRIITLFRLCEKKIIPRVSAIVTGFLIIISLLIGCESVPKTHLGTELSVSSEQLNILETCKRNLGIASPDTLRATMNLLAESEAGKSEAGIEYAYIAAKLMNLVYPVAMGGRSVPEPPRGSIYPGIFKAVESGKYPEIEQKDISFLSVLASSVVILFSSNKTVEILSFDNIKQAVRMNEKSVLPVYLRGLMHERNGRYEDALSDYTSALDLDPSCYPAETGIARIYIQTGRNEAAVEIMNMLTTQYPFSTAMLVTAAETRFLIKDYSGALAYSAEVLRYEPQNPEIQVLRARIFLNQKNFQQAGRLIDVLERMNHHVPDFYFIKSEVEKAGEDYLSALNTLEKGRSVYPDNKELKEAYGAVLMLAGRRDEAREILAGGNGTRETGLEGLIVLIEDAIETADWKAAAEYAQRLAEESGSLKAGIAVWKAWYYQEDYQKALSAAAKLFKDYPEQSDAAIVYVRTLIELNRLLQAERVLNERLPKETDPEKKSLLFYLMSLVSDSEEERLQALRSALFEDLQNIEALVGISRLYIEMGDVRKAYRYLKQAAALSPGDKEIMTEMAGLEELLD
ncbi:MAG: tetratricopeptide repeat protein [Spirochaetales bacterium]|nr:tetratricopeptide repeat protein [Spirochaetales bacterium]